MNKQECLEKACQIIRKRVRFKTACLRLPGTLFSGDDTALIRETTRLYTETWIVPLLDAIESGDMSRVKEFYQIEKGDPIKSDQATASKEETTP